MENRWARLRSTASATHAKPQLGFAVTSDELCRFDGAIECVTALLQFWSLWPSPLPWARKVVLLPGHRAGTWRSCEKATTGAIIIVGMATIGTVTIGRWPHPRRFAR